MHIQVLQRTLAKYFFFILLAKELVHKEEDRTRKKGEKKLLFLEAHLQRI